MPRLLLPARTRLERGDVAVVHDVLFAFLAPPARGLDGIEAVLRLLKRVVVLPADNFCHDERLLKVRVDHTRRLRGARRVRVAAWQRATIMIRSEVAAASAAAATVQSVGRRAGGRV